MRFAVLLASCLCTPCLFKVFGGCCSLWALAPAPRPLPLNYVCLQLFETKKDVTPAEASRLQATEGNMRWKAANVASLRAGADEQRALQEALLSEGDGSGARQQHL